VTADEASKAAVSGILACVICSLTLKMEAIHSFQMSVSFYQTTCLHVPEVNTIKIVIRKTEGKNLL
jgi:hypothetical protein